MAQVEVIKYQSVEKKKSNVPVTQDWNGVKIIRAHSIIATVKEVLEHNRFFGATRVGIVGNMGTGKSTLAITLAHLAHKFADVPYAVMVFDREALLHFQETISNLEPANYIVIIDDASFLSAQASKQKMDVIKQSITEIRHFPNQVDKRIILIINWHYEYGLDKMIRSTDFRYCTSVGISDTDNLTKLVGARYLQTIMQFQQMCVKATKEPYQFSFLLGKTMFTYDYRKPHIPLLYYNKHTLRFVVSPTRQFIDPICNLCSNAENKDVESDIETKHLTDKLNRTFGFGITKMAMRAKLLNNGINVYPKSVKQCMRAIDNYFSHKIINFEELAEIYDLKDKNTQLHKKINYDENLESEDLSLTSELGPKIRKITSIYLDSDLRERLDKIIGFGSNRSTFIEKIISDYLKLNDPPANEEPDMSIVLAKPVQPVEAKKDYTQYDQMDYATIVAEIEQMSKLPVEKLDIPKYEYLNDKARSLIKVGV